MRGVDHHRQVEARRQVQQPPEALAPARHQCPRVRRAVQAVPGQPDLSERDEPRVLLRHLALDHGEVFVGEVHPLGMKAEGGPHHLTVGGSGVDRPHIARRVAAHRDDAPDVVLDGARHHGARVTEHRVLEMAVAVDDHLR